MVLLDATGVSSGIDQTPQITAVGTTGEFVVTWSGIDSNGDGSIFVQKFHANGTAVGGGAVQLEATGVTNGADSTPQITAVGTAGEFVVTWSGIDSGGDSSIFVQKFEPTAALTAQIGTQQPDRFGQYCFGAAKQRAGSCLSGQK